MLFPLRGRRLLLAGAIAIACVLQSGCGGDSTVTTISGPGLSNVPAVSVVTADAPTGPNTTEIVVDSGPAKAFSLGVTNVPYVTVTVCAPGSTTQCATIDHVFLDTGSIGLRVLKSAVAPLALTAIDAPADAAAGTPAGIGAECYPFVLGAVWGTLALADVSIGGESAAALPVQIIDDSTTPAIAAPADCVAAANGELMNSAPALQANGVLGVGMIAYDCGVTCVNGAYAGGHALYWSCPSPTACVPAPMPVDRQVQNPVAHFAVDNNGTIIILPALPALGTGVAKGRLVFGIGTQANNQIAPSANLIHVDANPVSPTYLYFSTQIGANAYPNSYIDSGSNALFFDDRTIPRTCSNSAGANGGWYCPPMPLQLNATLADTLGGAAQTGFSLVSADTLFATSNTAFANLGGSAGQSSGAFVWGLPFFFGRPVYTSIWGQVLSPNGPWNAF